MILALFMLICVNALVPGVHSVHSSPFLWGGGVENPTKILKRVGLTGSQLLEGVAGKGDDFFQGWGLHFSEKI